MIILKSRDIPTATEEEFRRAVECESKTRRRLLGLVIDSGWTWSDVFSRELKPE